MPIRRHCCCSNCTQRRKGERSREGATGMGSQAGFGVGIRTLTQFLAYVWASPYTAIGLLIGLATVCTGGRARVRGRIVEFYGGGLKWLMQKLPDGQFILAFTLGHSVLGQTDASLDISRSHELIHVRQFERWGPFMGPAYLLCSLGLWLAGGRPYRDNPFEREAYDLGGGD